MLDATTGDVLAWVGGRNYAHSQFDRVSQARRQPGSAWKPFVYAAALKEGFVLSQPLADTPITVKLPGGRVWRPQNFSDRYEGRVTMRDALVRSKNVPTVRLASAIGLGQVASVAREAGIEEEPGTELPSMALGTVTVSPLELTGAYTAFANLGEAVAPRVVLRVEDESGRVLWESRPDRRPALEPAVAFLITDVLEEALERGTGTQVRQVGVVAPAAGKTGTTNDGADTWFVGYTPDLVGGVWLGFDQPRPILKEATGGSLAAPVWGRIVQRVYQNRKRPEPWKAPQGVVSRRVDPQTGLLLEDGCAPGNGRPAREELFIEGIEPAAYCPGKDAFPRDGFPATRMIAERKARETEEEAAEEARLAAIREAEEKKRREEAEQARLAEQKKGEEENRLAEIAEARRRAAYDARERREKELREEQTRIAEQKKREEQQKLAQAREKEEREKKALLAAEQSKREEAERIARVKAEEKRRKEEAEKAKIAEARELREREEKLAQAEAEADRREREIKAREEVLRAERRRREEVEDEEERRERIIREEERRAREDDERPAAREEERANDEEPEAVPAEDLSGWWEMTNTIQETNYAAYKGLRLGYRVQLEQDGGRIVGRGQKWSEDGRTVPSGGRTPITVTGTVDGRKVTLKFTEHGAKRTTSGGFSWTLSADRTALRGSFWSTAADTSGSSLARRMP
jgi:hypothetical protein